jgi:hypothetical protein
MFFSSASGFNFILLTMRMPHQEKRTLLGGITGVPVAAHKAHRYAASLTKTRNLIRHVLNGFTGELSLTLSQVVFKLCDRQRAALPKGMSEADHTRLSTETGILTTFTEMVREVISRSFWREFIHSYKIARRDPPAGKRARQSLGDCEVPKQTIAIQ